MLGSGYSLAGAAASPPPGVPVLEIHPCAGLANRLRAVASAICAAQDLSRACVIVWKQEPGIYTGTFRAIIDVDSLPVGVYVNDGTYVQSDHKQQMCLSPADWERIATGWRDPRLHINLKSFGHFYQKDEARWLAALRSLRPKPTLESHVCKILGLDPDSRPPLVGVHIRRTDNLKAIQESPTAAFVVLMDAYPPETRFVVATDDPVERAFFEERYGGDRVITVAEVLNRTSSMGSIDAFLDLLALSKCQEILGSFHSSFSEIAAAYGGCPLKIVRVAPAAAVAETEPR